LQNFVGVEISADSVVWGFWDTKTHWPNHATTLWLFKFKISSFSFS